MKKNFILDTNVLLHDPNCILCFEDNHVLIPIEVVEEIDHFKKEMTELGMNARQVSRGLDQYRQAGSLSQGVTMANGGSLRILHDPSQPDSPGLHAANNRVDNRILQHALKTQGENPDTPTIVVTKDINLRLRADALGLSAEDYETDQVRLSELYSGTRTWEADPETLDLLYKGEEIVWSGNHVSPNEFILVQNAENPKKTALVRVNVSPDSEKRLVPLRHLPKKGVWGIQPKNKEQFFGLEALLNPDIHLVTLMGKAGTGKTLIALAAGLNDVMGLNRYSCLLVSRPTRPMGGVDLGYLPGTVEKKMDPWLQPIFDSLDNLGSHATTGKGNRHQNREQSRKWIDSGLLRIEPLTYIRGRSINNSFLIVDEAQNLTPLEAKTILTRAGTNTKVIMTGDPWQIDNPYVDSSSNGFNFVVNRFRDQELAAHVELQKGVRSNLAELAANLL